MAEKPLLVIKGIPENLHVPDLRIFFEPAVEQGLFACFHFRRAGRSSKSKPGELTCRVRAVNKEAAEEIIRSFHTVPRREVLINAPVSNKARCIVAAVEAASGTRTADVWELHPPPGLPQGNVGTCRSAVLCAIRSCKLPASVIKRLGIVPSKIRSTRSSATIPPPLCWREPEPEAVEDSSTPTEGGSSSQAVVAERPLASAIFASLKKRSRPNTRVASEGPGKTTSQKLEVAKAAAKPRRMCVAMSDEESNGSNENSGVEDLEGRHVPRPLDTEPDDFDEPLEKAPHYERSDRLDSAAGYLYEDTVEHIWDKQDASGLVWYTDAAFWDRMAGDLDERCADAWDVEPDSDSESPASPASPKRRRLAAPVPLVARPRAMEQGTGLAAVRNGIAGRIMRLWGGCPSATPSSTLLAIVEGLQPNLARTGLGWVGEQQRSRQRSSRAAESDWHQIGSIYDPPQEEMKQRAFSVRPSVPASFSAASLYFAEDRRQNISFVAAKAVKT